MSCTVSKPYIAGHTCGSRLIRSAHGMHVYQPASPWFVLKALAKYMTVGTMEPHIQADPLITLGAKPLDPLER